MKRSWLIGSGTLCAAALIAAGFHATAAAQPGAAPPDKKQLAAMIEQMSAKGEQHAILDKMAGDFTLVSTMTVGPGMPGIELRGMASSKLILGGRFLQSHTTPAADDELKLESISIYGYDTRTEKYTIFGVDNWGTYSVSASGDYDEASKTITFEGINDEPGVGKIPFRIAVVLTDADTWTSTVTVKNPAADEWSKIIETRATRKK